MLIFWLTVISTALAASDQCRATYTHVYNSVLAGAKPTSEVFIAETHSDDPSCNAISNQQIRAIWRESEYDLDGFDCDHIIDVKGVPGLLDGCGREIAGNKIAALSSWNRGMGSECWAQVEVEKRRIYGNRIVDSAFAAVKKCCETATNHAPTTLSVDAIIIAITYSITKVIIIFTILKYLHDRIAKSSLAPVVE